MRKGPIRLAVTSGDVDGIGLEISVKSLLEIGPRSNVIFFLYRSANSPKKNFHRLSRRFRRIEVSSLREYFANYSKGNYNLVDIASRDSAADWVVSVAESCLRGDLDGLATAPLSKLAIRASGYKEIGHTELIQKKANTRKPFMAFIGKKFSVLLVTGHVALKGVSLTSSRLYQAGLAAIKFKRLLSPTLRRRPIAIVGLNPHAGEKGLIGKEELRVFIPTIKKLSRHTRVVGPLVPDAAFLPQNWQKYSVYVCPYHDQGLIPFKAFNGTAGVHITLGIPFVRTSVDHGTAKDLYGKNKADATSMKNAIEWAINLIKNKG